jgi:hypothetical protein
MGLVVADPRLEILRQAEKEKKERKVVVVGVMVM